MQVSSLEPAPCRGFFAGARTTSLVVLGLWAVARTAETGFALWVKHAASTAPPE
jgi:hypothetical protein